MTAYGSMYNMHISEVFMFPFVLLLFPFVYICRHVLVTSLSLFPVLSFQWIVGLSVTFDGPVFFQYTYVVLCSGQVK